MPFQDLPDNRFPSTKGKLLVDFREPVTGIWESEDDDLEGGASRSRMMPTPRQTGVFQGTLAASKNSETPKGEAATARDAGHGRGTEAPGTSGVVGPYAAVWYHLGERDLTDSDAVALHLRGDGRRYELRLRCGEDEGEGEDGEPAPEVGHSFETSGDWQEVVIQRSDFHVSGLGSGGFDWSAVTELGFYCGVVRNREEPTAEPTLASENSDEGTVTETRGEVKYVEPEHPTAESPPPTERHFFSDPNGDTSEQRFELEVRAVLAKDLDAEPVEQTGD